MNFDLFYTQPFTDALKTVYDLDEVPVLQVDQPNFVPFYCSRKAFKRQHIFNLPFNFYQTADYLRQRLCASQWEIVKSYATAHEKNISVTTIGELEIGQGQHVAQNSLLNLTDVHDPSEKYSRNLRSNLRTEMNKCGRSGLTLSRSKSRADLQSFYAILARQYVREHRMVFQPFRLYEKLLESGAGSMVVAKVEGRMVGGMFLLADGPVMHYNWGARASLGNISVGTLLVDYAICCAKSEGFEVFDFGSTPLSDSHLLDFKTRWGCETHKVFRYFTNTRTALIDLNSSFKFARRFYSFMPIRLASALMPVVVPWVVT